MIWSTRIAVAVLVWWPFATMAGPTVYVPFGTANQVIAIGAHVIFSADETTKETCDLGGRSEIVARSGNHRPASR